MYALDQLPTVRKGSVGVILPQNTWMAAHGPKRSQKSEHNILLSYLEDSAVYDSHPDTKLRLEHCVEHKPDMAFIGSK